MKVLGSIVATFAGWAAVSLYFLNSGNFPDDSWGDILAYPTIFAFLVWLLVVLPLHVCVPFASRFWFWPISTLCGIAGGVFLFSALFFLIDREDFVHHFRGMFIDILFPGILSGGMTGFCGSLTAPYFLRVRRA